MNTPPSDPVQLPTGPQVPFEAILTEAVKRIQSPVILGAIAFIALLFGGLFLAPGILDKSPALPWGVLGFGLVVLLLVVVPDAYLKARAQALREWREREEAHRRAEAARPEERLPISSPPTVAPPSTAPSPRPDPAALRDRYLRYLVDCCAHLQMTTLDLKAATRPEAAQLDLAAVFTDLDVYDVAWEEEMARKRQEPSLEREQADRRLPTLGAFSRYPRLALLGDPGSGKSTLVNFTTLCLAGDWLNSPDANLRRLGDAWGLPRLLPIRVILRDYAARGLPANQGLWEFIGAELKCLEPDGPLSGCLPVLQSYLERENGALLLLDGLDEVPEAHHYRLRLKEAVARFVRDFPNCRILVTSRPYAYRDDETRLARFDVRTLAPFTPEQVQTFIHRWYEHTWA